MKYLASFLFLTVLLFSCGSDSPMEVVEDQVDAAASEQAYQVMMEGHDRVMPLMGPISRAQLVIGDKLSDENLPGEERELLTAANERLEDAGDGMMEWMQSIKPLDELRKDMDDDNITEWITERTAKIASVESMMNSSLASANELLGLTDDGHGHDHGDGHDHGHDHKH